MLWLSAKSNMKIKYGLSLWHVLLENTNKKKKKLKNKKVERDK